LEGFLAVYPSGTGQNPNFLTWNAGNCCGYAAQENVDDVGFIRALLDDIARVAVIDSNRVFAAGMSNGGMLAYRLACELSERIAAIASVAGPMAIDTCRPTRPVSILHFHGTADEFTPYVGGRGARSTMRTPFRSVESSIGSWIEANCCPPVPSEFMIPAKSGEALPVERRIWGPGTQESEVALYTVLGGGHTWPGRVPRATDLGPSTTAISANAVLWDFFQHHPKR
jgi:polyhydroxybutyrate depolymerase